MSELAVLKQQNAELRNQIQRLKEILSGTKEYINHVEWNCKFATDKAALLHVEKEELLAQLADKEAALALGEAAVLHLGAKLWLHENNYGEMAGYIDAQATPELIAFLESQEFLDAAAEHALTAIKGGPER